MPALAVRSDSHGAPLRGRELSGSQEWTISRNQASMTNMQDSRTRQKLLLVLVAGFVIRLALLGMPGTEDMDYFRMWGAQALR